MAPATESQCAELLIGVSRQQQMFSQHVAAKERAARGSAEPTMALTLSRAHLQRALAAAEEVLAGRAWLLDDVIPAAALEAAERDDEVPVLLDLGTQRAVVFVGRSRHPQFWAAELERRKVEQRERALNAEVQAMGATTPTNKVLR